MSRSVDDDVCTAPLPSFYLTEGFLHLQNVIGQAIIENKTGLTLDMDISVEVSWLAWSDWTRELTS